MPLPPFPSAHRRVERFAPELLLGWTLATVVTLFGAGCGGETGNSSFTSDSQSDGVGAAKQGPRPGHFLVRLSEPQKLADAGQFEVLRQKIQSLTPELPVSLSYRFASGQITGTTSNATRSGLSLTAAHDAAAAILTRTLKVELTGLTAERTAELFNGLKALKSDEGSLYFDRVDTDKNLLPSTSAAALGLVEPDTIDDPAYKDGAQYYLEMIRWPQAIRDVTVAQLSAAVPVVVGVLDTGVLSTHEDLDQVMWRAPSDPSADGYDGLAGKLVKAVDDRGHGTNVAGIIGAQGMNGKGIQGTAYLLLPRENADPQPMVQVMSMAVLDTDGAGTSDRIGRSIVWAVDQHLAQRALPGRDKQKLIINISLAGAFDTARNPYELLPDGSPKLEDDAFDYAAAHDVLIVVAAGNDSCGIGGTCTVDGKDLQRAYYYPCSYQHVLCVAASTHEDKMTGFSNFHGSVGLTAPGWGIFGPAIPKVSSTGYAYYSGTSQATPIVSAAASIVWSIHPELSVADLETVLQKSSARIAEIQAANTGSFGRLDLSAALKFAAQAQTAGASPKDLEPADVSSTPLIASHPPAVAGDPYAGAKPLNLDPTQNAVAPAPSSSGHKVLGCGVVASGASDDESALIILSIAPLLALAWRRRRAALPLP